jgi:prophage antirepressor-like protein
VENNNISNSNNAMVKVFENEQFGNVRIIVDGDKYLFCGADVANALGYSNVRDAIKRHCRAVVKHDAPISGKIQSINFISEGDVYRLITHSKLPTAEKFESWVFDEVLPTLRKTGSYTMQDAIFEKFPQTPRDYRSALLALVDQIDINETLTKENKILSGEKLTWDNSAILVALVRKYASVACNNMFGAGWKTFYKELLYKYGINLESRKTKDCNKNPKNLNRAVYKYLAEDEWQGAIETAIAMCVARDIDISNIIKENVTDTELVAC